MALSRGSRVEVTEFGLIGLIAGFSIWNIITPAVVASLATLWFNTRAEKKRAQRDFITKSFDAAKDDIRRAIDAAADYFPSAAAERTPLKEAKIWVGERDTRHAVETLIAFSDPSCSSGQLLQTALDDFIDSLTGGSFGSVDATADLEQLRKIASTGARLRAAVSTARQLELQSAINSDVFSRSTRAALAYANKNLGPKSDPAQRVLPMHLPEQPRPPEQGH